MVLGHYFTDFGGPGTNMKKGAPSRPLSSLKGPFFLRFHISLAECRGIFVQGLSHGLCWVSSAPDLKHIPDPRANSSTPYH